MLPTKKWFRVLLVTGAVLVVTYSLAQEQPSNIFRDLEKNPIKTEVKETEDGGILCGYVAAFGVFLPRPYYVTFRDDTVWINDIAYYPRRPDPNLPPIEPQDELSDTAQAVFDLWRELRSKVPELYGQYGEQKTREMVMQEYQNNPLIKSFAFDESAKVFRGEFPVGGRFYVPLVKSHVPPRPTPPPEEVTRGRQCIKNSIRQLLLDGGIYLFGYNFETHAIGSGAYEIIDTILKVKRDGVSVNEGKKRIQKVIWDERMTQDIIEHLDSWPNDINY
jgi:hypothetical protein